VEGTLLRVTKHCAEVSATTARRLLPRTGPNWHVAAAFGMSWISAPLCFHCGRECQCTALQVSHLHFGNPVCCMDR
jgi:hypothetical protein